MKVAIVGAANVGRECIPWDDPEWEIWGFNAKILLNDGNGLPLYRRWDRWFHLHPPAVWEYLDDPRFAGWLKQQTKPVYMQRHYDEVPGSVPYPLEEIVARFSLDSPCCPSKAAHRSLLTCSVSQAIAMALHLGVDELGLYGVTAEEPYAWQKDGVLFWMGMAHAKTHLLLPADHPLMNTYVYGYEINRPTTMVKRELEEMRDRMSRERGFVEQAESRESEHFRSLQSSIDLLSYVISVVEAPSNGS